MELIKKYMRRIIFTVLFLIIFMFLPGLNLFLINFIKDLLDIINAEVEEADPNWLFATYAQSTAAIVAILGGFIVSRILFLSEQKNNFEAEIENISVQIFSTLKEYNKEKEKIIKINFERSFNSNEFKRIVKDINELDIEQYIEERLKDKWFRILNENLIQDLESKDLFPYLKYSS